MDIYILKLENLNSLDISNVIQMLSREEIIKGNNFHYSIDKDTYLFSKILQRTILGRELGKASEKLVFFKDALGKSYMNENIAYNISRSRGIATIAISHNTKIGIDVENHSIPIQDSVEFMRSILSRCELSIIKTPSQAILNWTLKEAYMKFTGMGLRMSPNLFGYQIVNSSTLNFFSDYKAYQSTKCEYLSLSIGEDYFLSIAYNSLNESIRIYNLTQFSNCKNNIKIIYKNQKQDIFMEQQDFTLN